MGLLICKLYSVFEELSNLSSSRILMLGLNAAGKTTILYKIKLNESVHTIPTIGFNVETVSPVKGINFVVHDIGGQENIRRLWTHYYEHTDGLIYIVDSNDRERLKEARDELHGILDSDEMRGVPVVVIANKQDLSNAMNPSEVAVGLSLPKMTNRKWSIHGACATTGDGIFESMKEMADMLQENEKLKEY